MALASLKGDDKSLDRQVAVKVADPIGRDVTRTEIENRLRDEFRILCRLRHDSIVRTIGLAKIQGRTSMVMEYVPGLHLESLRKEVDLPLKVALDCVRQLASALAHLHGGGPVGSGFRRPLVHRDVKLENVRLTPDGRIVLLDFGAAGGDFDGREGTTSVQFGTGRYLAPERRTQPNNPAIDVYALGVVLFELLTGEVMGLDHQARSSALRGGLGLALEPSVRALIDRCFDDYGSRPTAQWVEHRIGQLREHVAGIGLREWASQQALLRKPPDGEPIQPISEGGSEQGLEATLGRYTPLIDEDIWAKVDGEPRTRPSDRSPVVGVSWAGWMQLAMILVAFPLLAVSVISLLLQTSAETTEELEGEGDASPRAPEGKGPMDESSLTDTERPIHDKRRIPRPGQEARGLKTPDQPPGGPVDEFVTVQFLVSEDDGLILPSGLENLLDGSKVPLKNSENPVPIRAGRYHALLPNGAPDEAVLDLYGADSFEVVCEPFPVGCTQVKQLRQ